MFVFFKHAELNIRDKWNTKINKKLSKIYKVLYYLADRYGQNHHQFLQCIITVTVVKISCSIIEWFA